MSRTYFHDFVADARDEFDISYDEAVEYYGELRDQGFQRDDFVSFALETFDYEYDETEGYEWFGDLDDIDYDLDDIEDYWLEEGEEIEITTDLAYEEGEA